MLISISSIAPWIWVGVLIICILIETLTMGLTTIWAAIAAVPLIFIARTKLDFKWQLLIFVILTLVLIIATRPLALKIFNKSKNATNVNSMVGEEVIITKAITKFEKGEGKAKNGVIWSITSKTDENIPKGTSHKVVSIEGNTLIIE